MCDVITILIQHNKPDEVDKKKKTSSKKFEYYTRGDSVLYTTVFTITTNTVDFRIVNSKINANTYIVNGVLGKM